MEAISGITSFTPSTRRTVETSLSVIVTDTEFPADCTSSVSTPIVTRVELTCAVPVVPTVDTSTTENTPTAIPAIVSRERVRLRNMLIIVEAMLIRLPSHTGSRKRPQG
ncbi:unknown [Eubacterium sp. CAG:786]|nr:unknown [Eubacterium sp. CAG:786]